MTATHAPIGVGSSPAVCGPPCPPRPCVPFVPSPPLLGHCSGSSVLAQTAHPAATTPRGPSLPAPSQYHTPDVTTEQSLVLAPLGENDTRGFTSNP